MVTGACLTLALINLRLDIAGPMRGTNLFFFSQCLRGSHHLRNWIGPTADRIPAQYGVLIFWGDPGTWLLLASMDPVMEWETVAVPALKEQSAEADRWIP
jgi:hypothetical protein